MTVNPNRISAVGLDLSPRVFHTATVAASPAAGAETTIATLTVNADLSVAAGVLLFGFAAFTVGTSGVSAQLKLRQTGTSGTTIKDSGATTVAATNLKAMEIVGLDASPSLPNQVYVLTLTIGSGAAASTVSAVTLLALVI